MSNVIGKTQSGKDIYSTAAMFRGNAGKYGDLMRVPASDVSAHVAACFPEYTTQDHADAAAAHQQEADKVTVARLQNDPRGTQTRHYRMTQAANAHASLAVR